MSVEGILGSSDRCLASPKLPIVLLPYAALIFITTATCMFEYSFWDIPLQHKIDLTTLYGPYLALCKSSAILN